MEASEVTIEQIMSCAKDAGASDVHITVGISPKMRVYVRGGICNVAVPRCRGALVPARHPRQSGSSCRQAHISALFARLLCIFP